MSGDREKMPVERGGPSRKERLRAKILELANPEPEDAYGLQAARQEAMQAALASGAKYGGVEQHISGLWPDLDPRRRLRLPAVVGRANLRPKPRATPVNSDALSILATLKTTPFFSLRERQNYGRSWPQPT